MLKIEAIMLIREIIPDWGMEYFDTREIEGIGLCGLMHQAFTVGLFVDINDWGYGYRYCYANMADAREAIRAWDGKDHPPGPWIVRKGHPDGEVRRIPREYD